MKILATFLLVLLAGVSCFQWGPTNLNCLKQLNLSKETIDEVYQPWSKPSPEYNEILNDFLECSWKNSGNLNSNGEIVWDKIDEALSMGAKEHMENSKTDFEKANVVFTTRMIKMAYNSCQEEQIEGDTPGQKVVKIQNCVTDWLQTFKSSYQG
ncbi:hypothetical protein ILUMI_02907 [Ignelater luminosus]|uniref:Uncharacterized protein n=1 Tax=Ignelater luminosus TaxID=2038154 RepID=A0A8K0DMW2_IGNLU|nr:hypothetical protein ILUMI_02907 [Ignelater luminosus]